MSKRQEDQRKESQNKQVRFPDFFLRSGNQFIPRAVSSKTVHSKHGVSCKAQFCFLLRTHKCFTVCLQAHPKSPYPHCRCTNSAKAVHPLLQQIYRISENHTEQRFYQLQLLTPYRQIGCFFTKSSFFYVYFDNCNMLKSKLKFNVNLCESIIEAQFFLSIFVHEHGTLCLPVFYQEYTG